MTHKEKLEAAAGTFAFQVFTVNTTPGWYNRYNNFVQGAQWSESHGCAMELLDRAIDFVRCDIAVSNKATQLYRDYEAFKKEVGK